MEIARPRRAIALSEELALVSVESWAETAVPNMWASYQVE